MTHHVEHYAYVPYSRRAEYEALGWVYDGPLPPPHAAYSEMYRWAGEGEPVIPGEKQTEGKGDDGRDEFRG